MSKDIVSEINRLKKEKKAIILAHTYQPAEVQDVADYVGDSYGLSVQAALQKNSEVIVFCGVRFMAETAAILNPEKSIILPHPDAGCPMADMISSEQLQEIKDEYPDYLVMCYVNSTASVKALSDVCCTSSNAVTIASKLPPEKGIIFVPDKHLGSWVQEKTSRRFILWEGFCPTHALIQPETIQAMRANHPSAVILIHPEAPSSCRKLADVVLSTGGMCDYVKNHEHDEYCIATEDGVIHTLQKQNPLKRFYSIGIQCPNMKKITIDLIYRSLKGLAGERVSVPQTVQIQARKALVRMLEMSK